MSFYRNIHVLCNSNYRANRMSYDPESVFNGFEMTIFGLSQGFLGIFFKKITGEKIKTEENFFDWCSIRMI